jgi:hypothetical protein
MGPRRCHCHPFSASWILENGSHQCCQCVWKAYHLSRFRRNNAMECTKPRTVSKENKTSRVASRLLQIHFQRVWFVVILSQRYHTLRTSFVISWLPLATWRLSHAGFRKIRQRTPLWGIVSLSPVIKRIVQSLDLTLGFEDGFNELALAY